MGRRCASGRRNCGMKNGLYNAFFNNGVDLLSSSQGVYSNEIVSTFGSSLIYFLDPSVLSSQLQENGTSGIPTTAVAADSDPIGLMYDLSPSALKGVAASNTRRPLLGSDGTRNAFITFDGTDDYLTLPNTAKYLKPIHSTNPVFWIGFWIKMGASTDGVNQTIFANMLNSSANIGFQVLRSSANRIYCGIAYGSAGNWMLNNNNTNTVTVASGWTFVQISVNGIGANKASITIGETAAQTYTTAGGGTGDANSNLFIGAIPTPGDYGKFSLGQVVILNRIPTAGEITTIKNYNPAKVTDNFTPQVFIDYDFDQVSKVWADAAKTTPITDGTAVRAIEPNLTTAFGPLNRDATSASAGASAIWRDNIINSKAILEFDGTDDEYTAGIVDDIGGKWTLFIVAKNDDATNGSHLVYGSSYIVLTGSNYAGNAGTNNGHPYLTVHTAGGSGAAGPNTPVNETEGYNVWAIVRDGTTVTSYSGNGSKVTSTGITAQFSATNFGKEFIAGWQMDGHYVRLKKYVGSMSESSIISQINSLKTEYGL